MLLDNLFWLAIQFQFASDSVKNIINNEINKFSDEVFM